MERWGTWEQLLLGGAVLRHGIRDWGVVAAELRSRTLCPYSFTPEICKEKYEDLQKRYSGCTAWFEELRKQRMAELRQALEQSDDSIGSLESKLKTLKAEKLDNFNNAYGSSQTESPVACQKSEVFEFLSKEASKDGLSAGSFTQETQKNWSPECQNPAGVSTEETETKPIVIESSEQNRGSRIGKLAASLCAGQGSNVRKRRGKRKRKGCTRDLVKEGSVGESEFWGSADIVPAFRCKENSTTNSGQIAISSAGDDCNIGLYKDPLEDLMSICNSVVDNENGCTFRSRLDSQKRGRYKKMVRQHMDFDTIRSRISRGNILSAKELFRDLLLLANNALVFYSKNTREYKYALQLRKLVSKSLQQHCRDSSNKPTTTATELCARSPTQRPPAKPRSVRPGNCKLSRKVVMVDIIVAGASEGGRKLSTVIESSPVEPLPVTKKGFGRPRKVGCTTPRQRSRTQSKGRKRVRTM